MFLACRCDGTSLCLITEGTQVTWDLRTSFVPFLVSTGIRTLIAKTFHISKFLKNYIMLIILIFGMDHFRRDRGPGWR